jgi:hypothetical protein
MKIIRGAITLGTVFALGGLPLGEAWAVDGTIAQNSAWNVQRTGSGPALRIVAYGDSIKAGYIDVNNVAWRASTHVSAEYGAALWGQTIEVRRRGQSGAVAQGIFNRINSTTDRAFMQTANTIGVDIAMCGNDYLQARSSFAGQSGTCNYGVLETALANCAHWTEESIKNINRYAHSNVKLKVVGNLYYPGYASDNQMTSCSDPGTGQPINRRDRFLPLIAESNWRTCNLAEQYRWVCKDNFAEFMAADYDSNGDGEIDREFVRYRSGESLEDYLARILDAYEAGLFSDSNFKATAPATTVGYLLSDNTHMTYQGPTAKAGLAGGTPGGNVTVQFPTAGAYPDGKNPIWNVNGHDRMGYAMATNYDLGVDAGPDATLFACEALDRTGAFNDRVFWGPWDVWVDYGNGASAQNTVTEMAFALNNRYSVPGSYELEVVVTGAYGTLWEAGAAVNVLSTEDGMANLSHWINSLRTDGTLTHAQWNGIRLPLANASSMLSHGRLKPYYSMMGDFIVGVQFLVATGALSTSEGGELVDYAGRTSASASCTPRAVGQPPFGRSAVSRPERVIVPQGKIVEEEWIEIDGVKYDLDDPALLEFYGGGQ